jgi:hypothetical protein
MADANLFSRAVLWFFFQFLGMNTTGFTLAHRVHLLSKFLTDSLLKDKEREAVKQNDKSQKNQ